MKEEQKKIRHICLLLINSQKIICKVFKTLLLIKKKYLKKIFRWTCLEDKDSTRVIPKTVMNFIITITYLTNQPQAFPLRIICGVFSYFQKLFMVCTFTGHFILNQAHTDEQKQPNSNFEILKEMHTVTPIYGIITRSNK